MLPRVYYSESIISIMLTFACKSADHRTPTALDLLTSIIQQYTLGKNFLRAVFIRVS